MVGPLEGHPDSGLSQSHEPVDGSNAGPSAVRQAHDALMAFITSAPEGTRLPAERELAARFGVSRTTLRSATDRLALLGYLSVRHGSGTITRRPGPEQIATPFATALASGAYTINELYAVRLLLEPSLAALVARRHTSEELAALRAAASGDDTTFHTLLSSCAGNGVATQVVGVLIGLSGATGDRDVRAATSLTTSTRQHVAIVEALAEGDPDLARESMRLHLRWEARRLTAGGPS